MNEMQAVLAVWEQCRQAGETAFLATVVKTEGSTYRRPGARMLFTVAGALAGAISGGCLESDIVQTASKRTQNGPALVTYDSTANEDIVWGFGLGCNGVVQVLLERLEPDNDALQFIKACLERREGGVIATVLHVEGQANIAVGDRKMLHADGTMKGSLPADFARTELLCDMANAVQDGKAFTRRYALDASVRRAEADPEPTNSGYVEIGFERIAPPRPLVIFGAGHDALPVVTLAKQMGWHVTVVDPRSLVSTLARFTLADAVVACTPDKLAERVTLDDNTFALLMTHNFLHDAAFLAQLLASPARYIGVLGPKKRLERLLLHLEEEGMTPTAEQRARLHGPVGLDIGADNPDEIALSIVAEMQAITAHREGGALRERQAPLHASGVQELVPNTGARFVCGIS